MGGKPIWMCSTRGCRKPSWNEAPGQYCRDSLAGESTTPEQTSDSEDQMTKSSSQIFLEEQPQAVVGPVLVHRVLLAPPRPILCTDDPEATLLKAVQLLLAYPELDALPIVSAVRCTVVAHLTLSSCLASILNRLRGPDIMPLGELIVGTSGGAPTQRFFENAAEMSSGSPWVMRRSQPLLELLHFFAQTHLSGIPVVEDGVTGGVLGYVSRRDLLQFLDLAMQSAARIDDPSESDPEEVRFDVNAPVEVVLNTLGRHRCAEDTRGVMGASLIFEEELTLKVLLLRMLNAENRKMLFVQRNEASDTAPRLLRVMSASDVWLLLIGRD